MHVLANVVASPGLVDAAKTEIVTKIDNVGTEVGKLQKDAAIKKLLTAHFGSYPVDLDTEFTAIKVDTGNIKKGVDVLRQDLVKEIRSKKRPGIMGFLVRAGLGTAAALPAIAYLQENGLDFNPMIGRVGNFWNEKVASLFEEE